MGVHTMFTPISFYMEKYLAFISILLLFLGCNNDIVNPEDIEQPIVLEEKYKHIGLHASAQTANIDELIVFKLIDTSNNGEDLFISGKGFQGPLDSLKWIIKDLNQEIIIYTPYSSTLTSQWSMAIQFPGQYETYLKGFYQNKVVISDTVFVDVVNNKDFLNYNWSDIQSTTMLTGNENNDFYAFRFHTRAVVESNLKSVEVYAFSNTNKPCDEHCTEKKRALYEYIKSLYGVPIDPAKLGKSATELYNAIFHKSRALEDEVFNIWETKTSRIALLKVYKNNNKSYYIVHAESIK